MTGRVIFLALAAAMAAGLGGCVSLLPKSPPVQLYQVGRLPPPAPGAVGGPSTGDLAASQGVMLTEVQMPRAAVGDQILTVTGDQAAYIADARWVTPAALMFESDVDRTFAVDARRVRLLPRGDFASAKALLGLDVGDFEARYDNGAGAAPMIVVSLQATLSRPDGGLLATQSFTVRQAAAADRVGAIVDAFDIATKGVLAQVTAWTDAQAPLIAAPEPEPGEVTSTRSTTTTQAAGPRR